METLLDRLTREARERVRNRPKIDITAIDESVLEQKFEDGRRVCEAEYKKWLSYYDDDGRLKPGARKDPGYNASMRYVPIRLVDEERMAFIAAEKKRLGVV